MYGPLNATCVLYVDGFLASNLPAYSLGTGTVIGITRAATNETAVGSLRWKTIVWSSGVSMPEIGLTPVVGLAGAPLMTANEPGYWPPTLTEKKRSIAYLTSLEVTARLTGGAYLTPWRILTVTVFLSSETWASSAARSGTGLLASSGLKEYSGRLVASVTISPNV